MTTYRVYLIDGHGRMQVGELLEAADDAEAVARFDRLERRGMTAELWQGGRLVRKLPRDKG